MGLVRKKKTSNNLCSNHREKERNQFNLEKEKQSKLHSMLLIKLLGFLTAFIIIATILMKVFHFDLSAAIFQGSKDVIEGKEGTVTTISEASLEEVFEISELSTAEYAYNAIAYAYKADGTTPKYYVAYDGTVTAGIDFSKISIDIDENTKTITLKIPNCEILDTTVDFGSMKYIFKDNKYDTETVSQEAYKLCEADLKERVEKEDDLLSIAKENATAAVEALVNPWIKQIDSEYKVIIQ